MRTPIIFIVDRNPIHSSLLKYHLNINKLSQVQNFPNGQECLYRIAKNLVPDIIITDYDIGNYTGLDFLRKVKDNHPEVNLFYFSSIADPVLAMKLLEGGASDFIVKTSKLESGISELLKNLRYILKGVNQI
ncbi:MAG: response regulator [Bacteroidetes bacterium]|nr:response regulator [Bacteroidota bacterium]